jgi:DNA-directed RNA polymerase subunit RPC12/RpoP
MWGVFLVNYSERDLRVIDAFKKFEYSKDRNAGTKYQQFLKQIPENQKRYKCFNCFASFNGSDMVDDNCPECGTKNTIRQQCPIETITGCIHDKSEGFLECPVCGEFVCPQCLTMHSVLVISRVTGYLSDASGWSLSKRRELKDRVHVNLNSNNQMIRANQIT